MIPRETAILYNLAVRIDIICASRFDSCQGTVREAVINCETGETMKRSAALSKKELSDLRTLIRFVSIFCRENHHTVKTSYQFKGIMPGKAGAEGILLCPDCAKLVKYAVAMRLRCPYDPKPMCKKCQTHCYREDYREKIRGIMKFSGLYLVKHGRLDLLYHYFR